MNANSPLLISRVGVRAHDMGCLPAEQLAAHISGMGLECVQLAVGKALQGVDGFGPGFLTEPFAREVGAAFSRHCVGIEVLGCYINPIHPDHAERDRLLGFFVEHLRHARDFGCNRVALESGSLNGDYSPHPENRGELAFQELLGSMRLLVSEAERCDVVVGLEAVTDHVVCSPERMARLLDALPSPNLQVVFDPVNLLCLANHRSQKQIVADSLRLFGDRIGVVHAKDYRVEGDDWQIHPAGFGEMDYDPVWSWLCESQRGIAVFLEEIRPEQVRGSLEYLRNINRLKIS